MRSRAAMSFWWMIRRAERLLLVRRQQARLVDLAEVDLQPVWTAADDIAFPSTFRSWAAGDATARCSRSPFR